MSRIRLVRLGAAVVLTALAGCADVAARRQAVAAQWIGHPEAELVQALGAPNRSYEANGVKVLTYEARATDLLPGTPFIPMPGPPWWGAAPGLPPQMVTRFCDTNFAITNGVVTGVTLRGNGCG